MGNSEGFVEEEEEDWVERRVRGGREGEVRGTEPEPRVRRDGGEEVGERRRTA